MQTGRHSRCCRASSDSQDHLQTYSVVCHISPYHIISYCRPYMAEPLEQTSLNERSRCSQYQMMMSGKDLLKSCILSWWQKAYSDREDVTSSGNKYISAVNKILHRNSQKFCTLQLGAYQCICLRQLSEIMMFRISITAGFTNTSDLRNYDNTTKLHFLWMSVVTGEYIQQSAKTVKLIPTKLLQFIIFSQRNAKKLNITIMTITYYTTVY